MFVTFEINYKYRSVSLLFFWFFYLFHYWGAYGKKIYGHNGARFCCRFSYLLFANGFSYLTRSLGENRQIPRDNIRSKWNNSVLINEISWELMGEYWWMTFLAASIMFHCLGLAWSKSPNEPITTRKERRTLGYVEMTLDTCFNLISDIASRTNCQSSWLGNICF